MRPIGSFVPLRREAEPVFVLCADTLKAIIAHKLTQSARPKDWFGRNDFFITIFEFVRVFRDNEGCRIVPVKQAGSYAWPGATPGTRSIVLCGAMLALRQFTLAPRG